MYSKCTSFYFYFDTAQGRSITGKWRQQHGHEAAVLSMPCRSADLPGTRLQKRRVQGTGEGGLRHSYCRPQVGIRKGEKACSNGCDKNL